MSEQEKFTKLSRCSRPKVSVTFNSVLRLNPRFRTPLSTISAPFTRQNESVGEYILPCSEQDLLGVRNLSQVRKEHRSNVQA